MVAAADREQQNKHSEQISDAATVKAKEVVLSAGGPSTSTNHSTSILRLTDPSHLNDGSTSDSFKSTVQRAASLPKVSFTFRSDRLACFDSAPVLLSMPDSTGLSKIANQVQQDREIVSANLFNSGPQRGVSSVPQSSFEFRSNSPVSFDEEEFPPAPVSALDLTQLTAIAIELQSRNLPKMRRTSSGRLAEAAMKGVAAAFEDVAMHGEGSFITAAVCPVHLGEVSSETGHSRHVSDGSSYQAACSASDADSVSTVDLVDEKLPCIITDEGSIPTAQFIVDPICLYLDQSSKLIDEDAAPKVASGAQDSYHAGEEYDEHGYLIAPGLDLIIAANYLDFAALTADTCQVTNCSPHEFGLWHPKPERLVVGDTHVLNHTPGRLAKCIEHVKTPSTVASSARQCYAIMSPSRCGASEFPPPTPSMNRNPGNITTVLGAHGKIEVPCRPYRSKTSKSYEVADPAVASPLAKHAAKDVPLQSQQNNLLPHQQVAHFSSYLTSSELLKLRLQSAQNDGGNLNFCTSGVSRLQSNPSIPSTTKLPVIMKSSPPEPTLPIVARVHAGACFTQESSSAGVVLQRNALGSTRASKRFKAFAISLGARFFGQTASTRTSLSSSPF